jgi:fucose permease
MTATLTERTPLLKSQDVTYIKEKKKSINDLKPYIGSILSAFYMAMMAGLNDGSLGAIIPRLKEYYDIPNETISLFFLCGACGFFTSAALNGTLVHHFGQLKTIYIGATILFSSYLFLMMGLPFPVMGFFLICVGSGMGLLNAATNVYLANLPMATVLLNILHGKVLGMVKKKTLYINPDTQFNIP